jgi:hypothetical protein
MAAALPVLAIGSSLAATGFQMAGSMAQGQARADAMNYQAGVEKRKAAYGQIMTDSLQNTLANIDAVRSAAGTAPDSPTGAALRMRSEALGERDINQKHSNLLAQVTDDTDAAAFYRSSAGSAMNAAELTAGGQLLSGLSGGFKSFGGFG